MEKQSINLLFLCRYNRFRSRIAEVYFKKINKNKNIKVKSAGAIRGNPINRETIKIAKEFGLNIDGKTKGLSSKLLAWQDIAVVIADDVPPSLIDGYGKKTIIWKIKDCHSKKEIRKKIKEIMKKVKGLSKKLNKQRKK